MLNNQEQQRINELLIEHDKFLKNRSYYFAGKTSSNTIDFEDFYQEAQLALIQAFKSFNPEKGNWKNYLSSVINNNLTKVIATSGASVRLPGNKYGKISTQIHNLTNEGKTKDEIISTLGISESSYFTLSNVFKKEYLDENIQDNKQQQTNDIDYEKIDSLLSDLEKDIYRLYVQNYQLKEISKMLGISVGKVSKTFHNIIYKLRKEYNE